MLPLYRFPRRRICKLKLARILLDPRLQFILVQAALYNTNEFISAHRRRERVVLRVAILCRAMPVAVESCCCVFVAGFLEVAEYEVVDVVGAKGASGGHVGILMCFVFRIEFKL